MSSTWPNRAAESTGGRADNQWPGPAPNRNCPVGTMASRQAGAAAPTLESRSSDGQRRKLYSTSQQISRFAEPKRRMVARLADSRLQRLQPVFQALALMPFGNSEVCHFGLVLFWYLITYTGNAKTFSAFAADSPLGVVSKIQIGSISSAEPRSVWLCGCLPAIIRRHGATNDSQASGTTGARAALGSVVGAGFSFHAPRRHLR